MVLTNLLTQLSRSSRVCHTTPSGLLGWSVWTHLGNGSREIALVLHLGYQNDVSTVALQRNLFRGS